MTTGQIVAVAGVFVVSAVVSAVAGFGFSLISVPLISLVVDVHRAVVLATIVGASVTMFQALQWRRHAVVPVVRRTVLAAYCGMPIGLALFVTVSSRWLQLMLGVAVLVAVALLMRRIDLSRAGNRLDIACGVVSGVLSTSLSTNGPPVVFLLQSRRLGPDQFRGTITSTFAWGNIASIAAFASQGKVTGAALLTAVVTVPGMVAGLWFGAVLRPKVDAAMFRTLVIALLTTAGIAAIVTA